MKDEELEAHIKTLDRQGLLRLRAQLEKDVATIDLKIARAKTNGLKPGYRSLKTARKFKGKAISLINAQMALLKVRDSQSWQQGFITAAKNLLPPEQFRELTELAYQAVYGEQVWNGDLRLDGNRLVVEVDGLPLLYPSRAQLATLPDKLSLTQFNSLKRGETVDVLVYIKDDQKVRFV